MFYKKRITSPSIQIKDNYIVFKCRNNSNSFYMKKTKNNYKYLKKILGVKAA